jgi:predicted dehydrogenase
MESVNIGILGFAHGHVGGYCSRWRERPELGVRVTAGWDHDAARAEAAAKAHGLTLCASPAELLARQDIRGVVVAAETSRHAELVEAAAAAGKAIVLQKPISITLDDADRIVRAVERAGVPFTLAWQMRLDPHNLQARALLADGRFGRVFYVRRRHCLTTQSMKDFDRAWHVKPDLNRDIFADDAAHAVDFLYWLLGMPGSVVAELGTLLNPAIPNDHGFAIFRYAEGAFAEISCSFVAVAGENTLEIECERGVIVGNYGDGPSNSVRPAGAPQLKWWLASENRWTASELPEIRSQWDRILNLAGPMAEFFLGRRGPIATAREGRDVLRLIHACYESAESGTRVVLRPA